MRKRRHLMICVCILLLYLAGCAKEEKSITFEAEQTEVQTEEPEAPEAGETPQERIVVYVCGQVTSPGVYELLENSRVADALQAAGGMTTEAAESYWNQAAFLEDGQKIYVPAKEEVASEEPADAAAGQSSGQKGKINLNTAEKEELMTLSGVGSAKADAIISYRKEQGGFHSIEEIMEIEGIKEGVFKKIQDKITVE